MESGIYPSTITLTNVCFVREDWVWSGKNDCEAIAVAAIVAAIKTILMY